MIRVYGVSEMYTVMSEPFLQQHGQIIEKSGIGVKRRMGRDEVGESKKVVEEDEDWDVCVCAYAPKVVAGVYLRCRR